MKTFFNKNRIFIGIVALILIINLSFLATILINNRKYRNLPDRPRTDRHMMPYRQGMYLRDMLMLNEEQFADFSSSRDAFQKRADRIENDLYQQKLQLLNEMQKNEPDKDVIKKTGDEIGKLHSKLLQETSDYYLQIRKICTPDQKRLLDNFFTRIINGEEYDIVPDRRQPQREFRRNSNNRNNRINRD